MKTKIVNSFVYVLLCSAFTSCAQKPESNKNSEAMNTENKIINSEGLDTATFANGCFWCTEAIFQDLQGVEKVTSGYTGGSVKNPGYREVCTGETGHAECLQIIYDSKKISFGDLLEVFWKTHDPTTLNRQGNDEGTQYRSAIFYHNENQKELAEKLKKELNASGAYNDPIVTEITAFKVFYPAEDYHQQYFNLHGSEPYCNYVIQPKVEKFRKVFKDKLKAEGH
ncbi:MAG: peptide-methionine (S)-S-oxide reductase MsrA [Bacteroidota bacterium]